MSTLYIWCDRKNAMAIGVSAYFGFFVRGQNFEWMMLILLILLQMTFC